MTIDRIVAEAASAGVDGLVLVDPPEGLAERLRARIELPVDVAGEADLGADGRISLCPDGVPLLIGPGAATIRRIDGVDGAPQLDDDATHRLRIIDLACTGKGATPPDVLQPLAHPPLTLCVAASRRFNRHALRFLVRGGGLADRTVLRGGARVRGRLWDRALKRGFHLRFGLATTRLWTHWSQTPLLNTSNKARRRRVRNWLPATDTDTGDWIVFACLHAHLARVGWRPLAAEALAQRCLQLSPLAVLADFALRREDDPDALARLLAPHAVRIIECSDRWLIARWRGALRDLTRPSVSVDLVRARTRLLTAWYAALDVAGRLDLARAMLQVTGDWLMELRPDWLRNELARRDDRREIREALARFIEAAAQPVDLRRQLGAQRYGDPRYAEAQLFVADYDEIFAEVAALIPHAVRVLRATIG